MDQWEREDTTDYKVVVNHEEQYSIWPAHRELPAGWKEVGKSGKKADCLAHIKEVWTDMRPLSLRKQMQEAANRPTVASPGTITEEESESHDDLVERLCQGQHPVEASLRPEKTAQALQECLDRGYVHIKFTGTRGGTELGVRLDPDSTDRSKADFANARGSIRVVGHLTLNYVPVRCVADIDLSSLSGTGHLERNDQGESS